MRVRWRGLELPSRVVVDPEVSTDVYGRFVVEPFERGFGTTVGNSLRRILLSSLEGAAPTAVKIHGAQHEFTALEGMAEDVTDLVINLKSLVIKLHSDEPKVIRLSKKGRGAVTAGDITGDSSVEILNKDLHICQLTTEKSALDIELTVTNGRGYVSATELPQPEIQEIGVIPLDANYSPVRRVRYQTEDTRVGQRTNYDRLVIEVWTDGTVSPEMALVEAAKILRKHLNPFVQYFDLGEAVATEAPVPIITEEGGDVDEELQRKLNMSVQELDLSVRANNCLESAKIHTVGELVRMNESELLKVRSFGKTSLREVKRKLADLGLSLGMELNSLQAVEG
jgi:DNA-directed RNA polymerase subunit alpha